MKQHDPLEPRASLETRRALPYNSEELFKPFVMWLKGEALPHAILPTLGDEMRVALRNGDGVV